MSDQADTSEMLVTLTADIVAAHVSNNSVAVSDLRYADQQCSWRARRAWRSACRLKNKPDPAVSIRSSIKPDYIVCLEDGKKLKMLKRHLMTHYQHDPGPVPAEVGPAAPTIRWSRPTMPSSAARSPRRSASAPSAAAAGASARSKQSDAFDFVARKGREGRRRRVPPLSYPRRDPIQLAEQRYGCILHEGPHVPKHRHRGAVPRKRPAHHRAAQDHRPRVSAKPRIIPTSRRSMRAPPRSIPASRSPPSTAPSACSRKRASSSATISATAASRYEAAPETHHDHLIDVETGNVIEFVDEELEELQKRIAERLGFRLVDHRMELYGVSLDRKRD